MPGNYLTTRRGTVPEYVPLLLLRVPLTGCGRCRSRGRRRFAARQTGRRCGSAWAAASKRRWTRRPTAFRGDLNTSYRLSGDTVRLCLSLNVELKVSSRLLSCLLATRSKLTTVLRVAKCSCVVFKAATILSVGQWCVQEQWYQLATGRKWPKLKSLTDKGVSVADVDALMFIGHVGRYIMAIWRFVLVFCGSGDWGGTDDLHSKNSDV